jgi:SAM-dependent methyltransferase
MYLRLTPQTAICSPWHPCWPRRGQNLWRIYYSRTFPIHHPSTRLCLDLLILACREQNFASLLDVGCGSGILALAGALLGAPFCVGCDVSPAAMKVSRDNARRLHLAREAAWMQGSTEALGSSFDLVVANLPFQMQLAKSAELVRLSRRGIILSGFKDTEVLRTPRKERLPSTIGPAAGKCSAGSLEICGKWKYLPKKVTPGLGCISLIRRSLDRGRIGPG